MTISFYDFKNLPDFKQIEMAQKEGHIKEQRVVNELKFVLYEISCFSVEIIYKQDRMAGMNVFENKAAYAFN